MEADLRPASAIVDAQSAVQSAVSWPAIAAGAVAAAALSLVLIAFGAGLGLSAVSPWSDSGVSAGTFKTGTGIYLVIVAVMSSAVGGYLAARLRTKWTGVYTNEIFFRDTAHGFLAWAFATLISVTALTRAARSLKLKSIRASKEFRCSKSFGEFPKFEKSFPFVGAGKRLNNLMALGSRRPYPLSRSKAASNATPLGAKS